MAQRIIVIIGLLVLLGLITSMFRPPTGGANPPEEVVLQWAPEARIAGVRAGPEDLVGCLRWCWWTRPSASAVVLYHQPSAAGVERGAVLVGQSSAGWHELVMVAARPRTHPSW